MAQVFPLNPDPSDAGRAALIRTLAALPDDWTLLCARRVGDGLQYEVAAVLIHPEIGIALVDVTPADPSDMVDALHRHLDSEGFGQYFSGALPIVAASLAADALDDAGERLAEAFDAAPRLSITDMDWADAVIELLLVPDDLAMAGAGEAAVPAMAEAGASRDDAFEDDGEEAAFAAGPAQPRHAPDKEWPQEWHEATPFAAAGEREGWHQREGWHEAAPFAAAHEEDVPLHLVADEPAMAYSYRRSRSGLWATVAAVVLILGLGAGAWQLAEDHVVAFGPEPAGTSEVQMSIPPSPSEAGAPAERLQPARTPSPPVRLAAKDPVKPPPAPPTPTRIDPLPPPKPPIQMAAKNLAEAPPPPPKPTQVEPLPAPVATAERSAAPPAASLPPAAGEHRVAAAPPPRPRQKPRRAAPDDTPVRELMERQLDQPTGEVAETPARAPVREARAHPPIDAGDLPPLEEGTQAAAPKEAPGVAAVPAPAAPVTSASPSAPTAAVGPPTRLFGQPAPVSGSTASGKPAAAVNNAPPNPRECRPYTADTTLSGSKAPVQGIACRGADGQWRLVSEAPAAR